MKLMSPTSTLRLAPPLYIWIAVKHGNRPPRGILIDVVKSLLPTTTTTTTTTKSITDVPVKEDEVQCISGTGGGSGTTGLDSQKTDVEQPKTKLEKIHETIHQELEKTHKTIHQVLGIGETYVDKHILTHHYTSLPKESKPLCPTEETTPPPVVIDPVPSSSTINPKDKEVIKEGGGYHGEGEIDVRFGANTAE